MIPDLSGLEERLQGIKGIGPAKAGLIFREVAEYLGPSVRAAGN